MKPIHEWSRFRLVIAIAVVVVAILVVLQLAERVFPPKAPARAESTPREQTRLEPLDVEVSIEDGDTVVVETADHQRMQVGTDGDAAAAEALAGCIREEIDRVSKEPFPDAGRSRETVIMFGLRIQGHGTDPRVDRAVQKCVMGAIEDMPETPDLPEPPGTR